MVEKPATTVEVRFRNDLWETEGKPERTVTAVDQDLADLFAYARCWAAEEKRADRCDLTFSAMLAAMVAHEQPLCAWLKRYFDRLGVSGDEITKKRIYPDASLYPNRDDGDEFLATTESFRNAFDLAGVLRDSYSIGQPIAVRHFMAAYAVCPMYHLQDFRRFHIDRREWCLTLVEELRNKYPAEAESWKRYKDRAPPLVPLAFDNDRPDGRDYMHLDREVEAFARLIAARTTSTPLSIGVFGSWGSGKSFFMRRTRDRVAELATKAGADPRKSEHHSRIAQVEFNAWHYSETNLIASLVDHIFRNLRIDGADEDEETLRRRGAELMLLLRTAQQGVASSEVVYTAAIRHRDEAEQDLLEAERDLPMAVRDASRKVADAAYEESEVAAALEKLKARRDKDAAAAQTAAVAAAIFHGMGDEKTGRAVGDAADSLLALATDARRAKASWRPILIGAAVMSLAAMFALVAGTKAWTQLLGGVGAVGAFATAARAWLATLNRLSERGERFLDAKKKAGAAAAEQVAGQYAAEEADLEAKLQSSKAASLEAREQLAAAATTNAATELVDNAQKDLAAAGEGYARARREADDLQVAIERLSIDTLLGEFLDERSESDGYRSGLGIFSQVRNDFERLSKLMARATDDHYKAGRPPPTVSRIVLYIDDLDRCPEENVVEVLKAVHLLLAFDLFVCVVAVDPRWLTTSLLRTPGVTGGASALGALDEQFGKTADPVDYIEKIFQVPIWLRPVSEDRRPALLRSWLDNADMNLVTEQPPMTAAELAFLTELADFLPSKPRTLKRLANTYRLVKTALSEDEFRTFADEGRSGSLSSPYRLCMTQLAILSTERNRAIAMIESLDTTTARTMGAWLNSLEDIDEPLSSFLRTAVNDNDLDLEQFRMWLDRTRRYSFYL